ncbi:MAG: GNAT family N-acetyltransferase [Thermoplasmata archaeon]
MNSDTRMRWDLILKGYMDYLSKRYHEKNMEEKFRNIVENLNNNEFKNRVLIHENEVAAYAFLIPSKYRDRDIANMGFIDKKYCNSLRSENLVSWILLNSDRAYTIIDEVFNDSGDAENVLLNKGFKKIARKKMCLHTENPKFNETEYRYVAIENVDISDLSDAEFRAFSDVDESYFIPVHRDDRINSMRDTLHGDETEIIADASFCFIDAAIKGAIITVREKQSGRAFISDLFVDKNYRNRGIGLGLLQKAVSSLFRDGYRDVCLYVSESNHALKFYQDAGFTEADGEDYTVYVKETNRNNDK